MNDEDLRQMFEIRWPVLVAIGVPNSKIIKDMLLVEQFTAYQLGLVADKEPAEGSWSWAFEKMKKEVHVRMDIWEAGVEVCIDPIAGFRCCREGQPSAWWAPNAVEINYNKWEVAA